MDGSGNKSLSSTPTKRLSFSKDENDRNYQGWSLNVQNPKKPLTTTATKHFMSSTISAASKGNPPRKKILAERNGSLDTHLQKTPTFGSKTSSSIGFGEYEENALLDHLSSRPYDPLTIYISPRPTFLRYKPHRLRDIFLRRENEAREESSSCCGGSLESNNHKDVEDELGTSSLADGTQEDDVEKEGVDENEEEFEEVEEERCWSLKGVLKILLLLVVLVLSNSYISSNSPTPSPVMQAFGNPKNGSHMIQDHAYGFVNDLVSGNRDYTLVQNGAGIDEKEMMDYEAAGEDEYDDELDEPVEKHNGESEVLKIVEAEEKEAIEGFVEGGETEAKEFIEHEEKGEIAKLGSVVESQAEERAPEMVEASDVSDECLTNVVAMNHELHITEATTMSESPFINDGVGSLAITSSIPENFENEVANEPVKQEMIDGGIGSGWSTTSDQPEYYQIQSDKAEESLKEEELKKEKAVVVFSTLFLVIACLTSAFHFKRKRNAQKNFTPASFEPVVVEKCISMFASEANKNMENILPFTNMIEENCKGTYQRPVPSVVFLGEFEVGEISSLRSCGMRENEVIKTPPPLSHGRFTTETHSVPVHVQSTFSETPRPPLSYGRFTTEEKIVKKQVSDNIRSFFNINIAS
ncbi:hypothetical protein DKX38_001469 [Salix brachista]|uniref:Uncharacterized protein n=1 Tax=Salix brachista TaxID=2182728 RepID=A0A5N5P3F4_9ROSI|nr:hypothetical protein DKX38_001469 [Salix brachista]